MKTFKVTISIISLVILLAGCAIYRRRVEIISEPLGARIEVNNNYVGETPLETDIYYGQDHIIKATPRSPGQYTQTKYVPGHNLPKKIFFDMRLEPAPKKYEIDID